VPIKYSIGLDALGSNAKSLISSFEYAIAAVFFLDLILGFRRAFVDVKTGKHVTCPKVIARRYLKFYFWIDLLGCMPLGVLSMIKTIRLLRF